MIKWAVCWEWPKKAFTSCYFRKEFQRILLYPEESGKMFTTDSKYSQPTRYVYTVPWDSMYKRPETFCPPSRGKLKDRAEKKHGGQEGGKGFLFHDYLVYNSVILAQKRWTISLKVCFPPKKIFSRACSVTNVYSDKGTLQYLYALQLYWLEKRK